MSVGCWIHGSAWKILLTITGFWVISRGQVEGVSLLLCVVLESDEYALRLLP